MVCGLWSLARTQAILSAANLRSTGTLSQGRMTMPKPGNSLDSRKNLGDGSTFTRPKLGMEGTTAN